MNSKMKKILAIMTILLAACLLLASFGCDDDDDDDDDSSGSPSDDDDDTADDDDDVAGDDDVADDDDDDDTAGITVIYDRLLVQGAAADPNPETGAETGPELNKFPVYRFRQDTGDDPPRAVNGIVILIPGYAAGASDFFIFARDLVQMAEGDVEVWSVDRRANLLEDQTGLDAAEAAKDPWIANDYYFENATVNDKTFAGFLDSKGAQTEMMSEWGLDLHLKDLRKLIEMVPQGNRPTNIFMGGHSSGARTAQIYAAYEFDDGHQGTDDLAGILLLDFQGAVNPPNEPDYLQQVTDMRTGAMDRCGVMGQAGDSVSNIVFIQVLAMATTEGWGEGKDEQVGPHAFWPDWGLFELVFPIWTRGHDVILTNDAKWGLLFDDDTTIEGNNFSGQMGMLAGGEVSEDLLGRYPSEDGATYHWAEFDEVDPEENMALQSFLKMIYGGPSDFTEWYYPLRFDLEDNVLGDLETEGTWVHNYFKCYNSRVDAAVFALEGATPFAAGSYPPYRDSLGPVRGTDLPRTQAGFHVEELHDWGHIEVLLTEPDRNPFMEHFLEFVYEWSEGQVQVPVFGE